MDFKKYIYKSMNEAPSNIMVPWVKDNIQDVEDAINLIKTNCKDALKGLEKGVILFRGINSNVYDIKFVDPRQGHRVSRDSTNTYQIMMDASRALKDYPKRSNSLICSNDYDTASSYSRNVCAVFPYDGAKFAFSQSADFLANNITKDDEVGLEMASYIHSIDGIDYAMDDIIKIAYTGHNKSSTVEEVDHELSKISPELMTLLVLTRMSEEGSKPIISYFSNVFKNPVTDEDYILKSMSLHLRNLEFDAKALANKEIAHLEKLATIFKNNMLKNDWTANQLFKIFSNNPSKKFTEISSILLTPDTTSLSLLSFNEIPFDTYPHEIWFSHPAIILSMSSLNKLILALENEGIAVHNHIHDAIKLSIKRKTLKY